MLKRKFIFSNDLFTEVKILGIIKSIIGILCASLLTYHICIYITQTETSINSKLKISTHAELLTDQNPVASFLKWGSDRWTLAIILPYLDCIAFTGLILLWAGKRRMIELFQLWIISGIIFCMTDMILIIPIVSYSQEKFLVITSFGLSSIRKLYAFWIVKEILGGLRAEQDTQDEQESETSSFKRY